VLFVLAFGVQREKKAMMETFFLIFQLIMEDGESRVILVFADAWH
jgi:hypothetical protein